MIKKLKNAKIPMHEVGIEPNDFINRIYTKNMKMYDELSSQKVVRYNVYIVDQSIDLRKREQKYSRKKRNLFQVPEVFKSLFVFKIMNKI